MLNSNDIKEPRQAGRGWVWLIIAIALIFGGFFLYLQGTAPERPDKIARQTVTIEGAAMEPTLPKGVKADFTRVTYYNRGDVVWFDDPTGVSQRHVRRIVAVAGDTIEQSGGVVYLNGAALREAYLKSGVVGPDFAQQKIGPDQFFVLGDNRASSQDSRQWGPIRAALVRGTLVNR